MKSPGAVRRHVSSIVALFCAACLCSCATDPGVQDEGSYTLGTPSPSPFGETAFTGEVSVHTGYSSSNYHHARRAASIR